MCTGQCEGEGEGDRASAKGRGTCKGEGHGDKVNVKGRGIGTRFLRREEGVNRVGQNKRCIGPEGWEVGHAEANERS